MQKVEPVAVAAAVREEMSEVTQSTFAVVVVVVVATVVFSDDRDNVRTFQGLRVACIGAHPTSCLRLSAPVKVPVWRLTANTCK